MGSRVGFFSGSFAYALDGKHRVQFPQALLAAVPAKERGSFDVVRGLDGCIWFFTPSRFNALLQRAEENANEYDDEHVRAVQRRFFRDHHPIHLDKQRRILLPESLRKLAGIKRQVVFLGSQDRIELWNPDRLDAYLERFSPFFDKDFGRLFGRPKLTASG